jgi:hypothetical protein
VIQFVIPIRVVSEANQREHWRVKYRRKNEQQYITILLLGDALRRARKSFPVPATVRLVRLGAKALDVDNLAGSFKHVQDAIARYVEVDDGDPRVKYEYAQEPNGKREYSVRVEILET